MSAIKCIYALVMLNNGNKRHRKISSALFASLNIAFGYWHFFYTLFLLSHRYHVILRFFFRNFNCKKSRSRGNFTITWPETCAANCIRLSYESENYVKNILGPSSNYFKINYYIKRCELAHDVIKLWVENWSDLDPVLFSINSSQRNKLAQQCIGPACGSLRCFNPGNYSKKCK